MWWLGMLHSLKGDSRAKFCQLSLAKASGALERKHPLLTTDPNGDGEADSRRDGISLDIGMVSCYRN